jgi:hypothetical protein
MISTLNRHFAELSITFGWIFFRDNGSYWRVCVRTATGTDLVWKMTKSGRDPEFFSERWKRFRRAFQEFFYGMTVHELDVETRRARGELEQMFMLIVFGDLIGLPILPPYYSARLLPHILPTVQRWKRSVLREKDLTDLGRVDI